MSAQTCGAYPSFRPAIDDMLPRLLCRFVVGLRIEVVVTGRKCEGG